MDLESVYRMWMNYQRSEISQVSHPDDHMRVRGADWYFPVGKSAVEVLCSVLLASPSTCLTRVAEVGCGYGRVSRHLCKLFPDAHLVFGDQNPSGAEFCAKEFNGAPFAYNLRNNVFELDGNLDLIWVGSVFTHIAPHLMLRLFSQLYSKLSQNGTLVITTHGQRCLDMAIKFPYIEIEKWRAIIEDYRSSGVGYRNYDDNVPGVWGVSLISPGKIWEFAADHPTARLVYFKEAAWADHQDVAAWTRT